MLQNYELVILLKVYRVERICDLIKNLASYITTSQGGITKVESWGKRNLAFKIKNNLRANYLYLEFQANPSSIDKLKTILKRDNSVILSTVLVKDDSSYDHTDSLVDQDHCSTIHKQLEEQKINLIKQ